jgi:4a-hydroxytetrahydrobiopterin dehydratase
MADLLTDEQVHDALEGLPDWRRDGDTIERKAELANFPEAIRVVNEVAEIAEGIDHHPDIDIRWRTLIFRLSTHSAGGLTGKDIELAGRIDQIIAGI